MENLRHSAANGCEDTYDVFYLPSPLGRHSERPKQRRVLEDPDGDDVMIGEIQVNEEVEHPWSEVSATEFDDWQQRKYVGKLKELSITQPFHEHARSSMLRSCSQGFQVRKPKVPEGCPEVIVRESPDELTLRGEEVGTSTALLDVNHIEPERWGPPLVDAGWCAFCQALYIGIEGEDWEDMCESHKEMSGAVK